MVQGLGLAPTLAVARNSQKFNHGGRVQHRGRAPIVSAALSKRSQNKKNASVKGSLKFREVSNSFWEATRREKTRLKKVSYLLTYLLKPRLHEALNPGWNPG